MMQEKFQASIGCLNSAHNRFVVYPSQVHDRLFLQQGFYTIPMFRVPILFRVPIFMPYQALMCPSQNRFHPMNNIYPSRVEDVTRDLPFEILPQAQKPETKNQNFDYFVVMDFEATCAKDGVPDPQEIIEFPSVIMNGATGELECCFQTYVRPSFHPLLSDFCKELTGIKQAQVDDGVSLNEALVEHDKWLEIKGIKSKNFAVVTWSDWDCRVMLESECKLKNIKKPSYFNRWINLKNPFREVFKRVHFNLKEAMQLSGLEWEGRAHSGLDDARNTARLLAYLMQRGYKFSITGTISEDPTSEPVQTPVKSKGVLLADVKDPKPCLDHASESGKECFCGKKCMLHLAQQPGPAQGKRFFGCGKWTRARRPACNYCVWVK